MSYAIPALLFIHWLADFVLQTRWMAENKSKSWKALLLHVAVYTFCLLVFGWKFALLNGSLHFVVDATTSRLTSWRWKAKDVWGFFVIVGFDQMLHILCLLETFRVRSSS